MAKTGPGWNTNARPCGVSCSTGFPVMSPGSRSGVNWIRLVSNCSAFANPFTNSVLPSPGSPSNKMCPRASSPQIVRSINSAFPNNTCCIAPRNACTAGAAAAISESVA